LVPDTQQLFAANGIQCVVRLSWLGALEPAAQQLPSQALEEQEQPF